jgi:hypothetical protein
MLRCLKVRQLIGLLGEGETRSYPNKLCDGIRILRDVWNKLRRRGYIPERKSVIYALSETNYITHSRCQQLPHSCSL